MAFNDQICLTSKPILSITLCCLGLKREKKKKFERVLAMLVQYAALYTDNFGLGKVFMFGQNYPINEIQIFN